MELVFNERRDASSDIEYSRGRQGQYHISFIAQLWWTEEPRMYVWILKRMIYDKGTDRRVGMDETSEAILESSSSYTRSGKLIRMLLAKLDSLSFESFIGDWCTEKGEGWKPLDTKEEF
jgi:hypothetical protein